MLTIASCPLKLLPLLLAMIGNCLRKKLIRPHKTYRSQLFKIEGSKGPIPFDDLESTRTTFTEMKNGTKKVQKDDWRKVSCPEKRLDK